MSTEQKAKKAVQAAKAKWGAGWAHMSQEQRAGAIALQLVALVVGQDEETAPPALRRLQEVCEAAMKEVDEVVA